MQDFPMWRGIFIALLLLLTLSPLLSWAKTSGSINSTADAIRQQREVLNIAVLNQWAADQQNLQTHWQPFVDYLNREIPFYYFNLEVLNRKRIQKKLEEDKLDLIILDPGTYVVWSEQFGIKHFLTLERQHAQGRINQLSSLLIAPKNSISQNDIGQLSGDITLLHHQIQSEYQFSPLWLSIRALNNNPAITDIELESQPSYAHLLKTLEQPDTIAHLASGQWEMLLSKHPQLADKVDILNPHPDWDVPFKYSTTLLPEWPLAGAWHTPKPLLRTIAIKLLSYSEQLADNRELPSSPQGVVSWSIPQNYDAVKKLYADLHKAPFERPKQVIEIGITDVLKSFWQWLLAGSIMLLILALTMSHVMKLNQRLRNSTKALKAQIAERNLAQEKALQHQADLAHVARLSTMGEMASGLAHELNQPLSAINSYVQGCSRRIKNDSMEPEPLLRALDLTAQQATRAGEIIRRLRNFVRKGEPHKTPMDINHVVHEVVKFLETPLEKKQVKLTLELLTDPPPVMADIIQVEQVLLNLVKNAIEAMVKTPEDERKLLISTSLKGRDEVRVSVMDSGHGISQDKIDRVFNPFFTTKHSGMGMGLSISHSIIEAHGGQLSAKHGNNGGAVFFFTLPMMQHEPTTHSRVHSGFSAVSGGNQRQANQHVVKKEEEVE